MSKTRNILYVLSKVNSELIYGFWVHVLQNHQFRLFFALSIVCGGNLLKNDTTGIHAYCFHNLFAVQDVTFSLISMKYSSHRKLFTNTMYTLYGIWRTRFFARWNVWYTTNWWNLIWAPYAEVIGRSQGPRGLRRKSTAAHLLRLWIQIP